MKQGYTPKISEHKKKIIGELVELMKKYSVVGVVNMENLPAPQLQQLRSKFRGSVKIVMSKKSVMKVALENTKSEKKGLDELSKFFEGMPALILTNQNPFKVSSIFQKNKSSAPARPNQIAPEDIVIPAGQTPFAPGPIISDLGMIGIKTGVEGGKVVVKQDCVVAKKGERIKPKVADVLARLSIQPMEVGLEFIAAYYGGVIYKKDTLSITQEEYFARIIKANSEANTLAIEISYMTKETINQLIINAFMSAKFLAESQKIPSEETKEVKVEKEGKRVKKEEKSIEEGREEIMEEVMEEVKEFESEEKKIHEKVEKVEIKELKEEPEIIGFEEVKEEPQKLPLEKFEERKEVEETKEVEGVEEAEEVLAEKEEIVKKPRMVSDVVSIEKAEELLEHLKKAGSFRKPVEEKGEEPKRFEKFERLDLSKEKIEELAKELRRKGTLRGKGGK